MLIFLLFLFSTLNSSQIYINEIVSDNDGIINDFEGESPDWIELYNPNDFDVNLYDYSLTDDYTNPIKWTFPDINIKAKSFLVIFCSGKDALVGEEIHTNFSISSEGEELFLYDNNPDIVKRKKLDFIEIPALRENKAYGKLPDGDGKLSYLSTYSPGETNIYSDEIICNYESGFYKDSIIVELESTMGYEIRYTLDGKDPDENSPIYTKPIKLYNSSDKPNKYCDIITTPDEEFMGKFYHYKPDTQIKKVSTLKYKSFSHNSKIGSSEYINQYYINNENDLKGLPIVSLILDSIDLFGYEEGIYVPGIFHDTSNKGWSGNYYQLTEKEDKIAEFIYFDSNFKKVYSQNVEINILGGGSRIYQQKSLKISGKNLNGPDELEFNLYNSKKKQFKDIKLKSAYGVWSQLNIFQNELGSEIASNLNVEKLNYKPAMMFLNGEFWGITTITEHRTKDYLSQFHSEDKDSVEIVMHHYTEPKYYNGFDYPELIEFMQSNSLEVESNYKYIKEKIDIESFIDYYLFQIYIRNMDWPFANMNAWKSTNPNSKWRWILYDLDGGFSTDVDYNMFEHLLQDIHSDWPNSKYSTLTFRMLIKNKNFKNKLYNRCVYLIENDFSFNRTRDLYEKVKGYYAPYISLHYERWNYPFKYWEWWINYSNEYMLEFFEKRPPKVLEHLEDFMNLTSYDLDECYGNQCDDNGITIYPNPSNGKINIKSIDKYRNSNITVYNHVGKVVYNLDDLFVEEGKQLDLSLLINGVYFIRFENQFGQYTFERIVINR